MERLLNNVIFVIYTKIYTITKNNYHLYKIITFSFSTPGFSVFYLPLPILFEYILLRLEYKIQAYIIIIPLVQSSWKAQYIPQAQCAHGKPGKKTISGSIFRSLCLCRHYQVHTYRSSNLTDFPVFCKSISVFTNVAQ